MALLTYTFIFSVACSSVVVDCQISTGELAFSKKYLPYKESIQQLSELVGKSKGLAKLYTIGKSTENRDLWVVKLSTDRGLRTTLKPRLKFVGGIHGNEGLSSQLLLILSEYLIKSFGQDIRVTRLLNQTEIHILPIANPDGREIAKEGDCDGSHGDARKTGRENANNEDLDNNFPGPFDSDEDAWKKVKQNETLALMKWIVSTPFVLSASLHTGSLVVSYPYDSFNTTQTKKVYRKKNPSPDDELFQALALTYVKNHSKLSKGDNCPGAHFKNGITNGAAWYIMKGGMADFNYAFSNCMETTLELSCCKYPDSSQLTVEWDANWHSLLAYMEQVHMGVKGLIRNKAFGTPIQQATISIEGINHDVKSTRDGEYWRLLLPGQYHITATAPGYKPLKRSVNVKRGAATTVDFALDQESGASHNDESTERKAVVSDASDFLFKTQPEFRHHNYKAMTDFLHMLAEKYPTITRLKSIGKTVEHREMWALEISDHPGTHEVGEPEMKIVANLHGNEVVGREMCLILAQLLCESYGTNARLTKLVNNTRIFLMPSINPDGYERAREGDYGGLVGRFNAHNVDLNRNFPDKYRGNQTEAGYNHFEPETIAMMNWITSRPFVLSASLHGGALVASYPFDGHLAQVLQMYSRTEDDELFRNISRTYSFLHPKMHKGEPCSKGFTERFDQGITNGAQWYILYGGMQDYNYLESNAFEITIEMGCQKFPPANQIEKHWEEHKRSLVKFIEQTHMGIKGTVTDENGKPMSNVVVHVSSILHDVKTAADGDYWRLLLPGTYQVSAVVDGIHVDTKAVSVPDDPEQLPVIVNFSVNVADTKWSQERDFGIAENMARNYWDVEQLNNAMGLLKQYDPIVKVKQAYDNVTHKVLEFMYITNENIQKPKPHFLLLGGLRGNLPVAREIIIRFARHLVSGYREEIKLYRDLIENSVLHLVPYVGSTFSDFGATSDCTAFSPNEDVISASRNLDGSSLDSRVNSLRKMFEMYSYAAALELESGSGGLEFPSLVLNDTEAGGVRDILEKLTASLREHDCSNINGVASTAVLDYAYQQHATLMASASIECCAYPSPDELYPIYRKMLPVLLKFFDEAMRMSVVGTVQAADGKPVKNIQLSLAPGSRHDIPVRDGAYSFLASPGGLYLTASAVGYDLAVVSPLKTEGTQLNVESMILSKSADMGVFGGYTGVTKLLKNIAQKFPNQTKLTSLASANKKSVWLLEVSATPSGPHESPHVPCVLITAGHHGSDVAAIQTALNLVRVLTSQFAKDRYVTQIVNTTKIFILPMIDVDSVPSGGQSVQCDSKYNFSSYENVFDDSKSDFSLQSQGSWSQQAFSKWLVESSSHLVSSLSLKSGATGVLYSSQGKMESVCTAHLAQTFRTLMPPVTRSNFSLSTASRVRQSTERETLRRIEAKYSDVRSEEELGLRGTLENALAKKGILAIAVYQYYCSVDDQLHSFSQAFKPALLRFLSMVHEGIQGRVVNSNEQPLAHSVVYVEDVALKKETDHDGRFSLPLPPGKYAVEVFQPGYFNMTKLVQVLLADPSTEVVFTMDAGTFFGISSTFMMFTIFLLGMGTLVLSYLLCNGTFFGRGESLRRKGFIPLATNEDVLEFKRMDQRSEGGFLIVRESKAPGGYSDLRALELSDTENDSDEEICAPKFRSG